MGNLADFKMEQTLGYYRRTIGLSLQECAKRSGIPAPHLSAFEHGYKRLSVAQLYCLCDVLYARAVELEHELPTAKQQVQAARQQVSA